ncbi:MAG: ATP-NAD kinase family protein [Methanomassiliicoccales archaeon]
MKKVGLIVNPIAGMGGRVGLKGSDGADILKKALALGAKPEATRRAREALEIISKIKESTQIITYPLEMGEYACREAGFDPFVIGEISPGATTPEDTITAARALKQVGVDLLLFAGGDGTARNIYNAIGISIPVVGIPAGVKIHSAVYAVNPRSAGLAATLFLEGKINTFKEAEIMDIDETAFRAGRVSAALYGYLLIPEVKHLLQNVKAGSHSEKTDMAGMAAEVVKQMEADILYIIGPGTTPRSIMERLGLENTLLGVDVVKNGQLLASDVSEEELYRLIENCSAQIIITAIGGQGHIFGRGNQQISPRIINTVGKENIMVIASKDKLVALQPRPLLVDTGDPILDQELCGYTRVITSWEESVVYKIEA